MAKRTVSIEKLMASVHKEVQGFINEDAPVSGDKELQLATHELILKLRHTRLKFLQEPDGKKRLRPQIDEIGIQIFKLQNLLTERGLEHPPKCTQQLRDAGIME